MSLYSPVFHSAWRGLWRAVDSRWSRLSRRCWQSHSYKRCSPEESNWWKVSVLYALTQAYSTHTFVFCTCNGLASVLSRKAFMQAALMLTSSSCDVSYRTDRGICPLSRISASRILPLAIISNFFSTAGSWQNGSRPGHTHTVTSIWTRNQMFVTKGNQEKRLAGWCADSDSPASLHLVAWKGSLKNFSWSSNTLVLLIASEKPWST